MNPFILVAIGVVGLLGFAVLFYVGFNMWQEERQKKRAADSLGVAAANLDRLERQSEAAPAAAQAANAHEVLRVLRDNLSGRLLVEIGGRRYAKIADIQDPSIGQGFLTTLRDLERFAGRAPAAAPSPPPVAKPAKPTQTETAKPTPPVTPAREVRVKPDAPAVQAKPTPPAPASELRLPSMNPFKQRKVLKEMEKSAPPTPKAIADQIDEIVQDKIAGTPLVRRGLRVRTGARGGAVFELDGKKFEAVGDLPDADVAALIRAAIQEWEARQ